MTTWLPLADGGILARWVCANNEEELLAAARLVSDEAYEDSGLHVTVGDSPLVLLAACESFEDQIYPRLEFQLVPGQYRILMGKYDDESTSLICHRLKLEILN
jgi:hypothetical protein